MIAPHHSGLEWQIDSIDVDLRKIIIERLKREFRLDPAFQHHDTGDFLKGAARLPGVPPQFLEFIMNDTIGRIRRIDDKQKNVSGCSRTENKYMSAPYFARERTQGYTVH